MRVRVRLQNAHSNNGSFVAALYADVLGRAADASGLALWVQYLQNGGSRQAAIQAFLTSPETFNDILVQDYAEYLNRPLDAGGAAESMIRIFSRCVVPRTALTFSNCC